MKVLVCNLGSTSFKYSLFELAGDAEPSLVAKGGAERVVDFGPVIEEAIAGLERDGHLGASEKLAGVGFKTVLGGEVSGCVIADDTVLDALDRFKAVAPAHNPAYAAGIRQFRRLMPDVPLVALFETAFYQWMPEAATRYAVPQPWYEAGVRRYGFHGASHKFIAERSAELLGREDIAARVRGLYQHGPVPVDPHQPALRVISCHLGGSSSVSGIENGVAIGNSMGLSPQSGLPQNNRVGDLDSMAISFAMGRLSIRLDEAVRQLSSDGGMLGLSGVSNDVRDIKDAAAKGNARARLALDVFLHSVRHWIGAYYWQMGGADAIVFTGGIGENNADIREVIVSGMEAHGVRIDSALNATIRGSEAALHEKSSDTSLFLIPANEEVVIAREVGRTLAAKTSTAS